MAAVSISETLSDNEIAACGRYAVESRYLNAIAQGRSADFQLDPEYRRIWPNAATEFSLIRAAISKMTLDEAATLFAGHGNGGGIIGSLRGDPERFIGLGYSYSGFISTSEVRAVAESFVEKSATDCSQPVMLQFHLPQGFNAFDFAHIGGSHEFEYLLGSGDFVIVDTRTATIERVAKRVLELVLEPVAKN